MKIDSYDSLQFAQLPSHISSSDEEDSNNEIEGTNVEGAKSDEDATYEEDQGNEAVEDTNTNLDGRDDDTDVNIGPVSSNPRKLKTLMYPNSGKFLMVNNKLVLYHLASVSNKLNPKTKIPTVVDEIFFWTDIL
ncbi:hypothetical protein Tco_1343276 [Tanacetum coccineum]